MGKKQKSQPTAAASALEENAGSTPAANGSIPSFPFFAGGGESAVAVDPMLASLFEKSAGPVKAPQFTNAKLIATSANGGKSGGRTNGVGQGTSQDDMELTSSNEEEAGEGASSETSDQMMEDVGDEALSPEKRRKRKRGGAEDIEESYMRRMAKEEAKEDEKRRSEKAKRQKIVESVGRESDSSDSERDNEEGEDGTSDDEDGIDNPPIVHESNSNKPDAALLDKSARTIFLSNVSTEAIKSKSAKKTLLKHLCSFFPSIPESATPHKIESIRFRSTAFSTQSMPKRAAYAKRELMDSTTRSTNAYVVYSTTAAARGAPRALNGSIILDRHLRVDSVAHPAPIDYKRCIFVGNLGFVDEETPTDEQVAGQQKEKKKRKQKHAPPADVEEGLWRTFNEHTAAGKSADPSSNKISKDTGPYPNLGGGPVESVRVIRDPATRIGKGVAYVQFRDENAVEMALLLDGQKFPPLLPRKLRVTRAKRVVKKTRNGSVGDQGRSNGSKTDSRNANKTRLGQRRSGVGGDRQASFEGRATALLGKAGGWRVQHRRSTDDSGGRRSRDNEATSGGSSPFVFEGFRARPDKGPGFKVRTKSRGAKARAGQPKSRNTLELFSGI
ncbi:nucleolar protein 12 [Histoplasma capsulatum var. duboisii H88]|uniref:Nucleolar protein 12 n=2 Tax=Ajellomyces capsulatus TaxID=5037 RepID=F0UE93_AJEC8|nr:nucleolar protein [Histoplasma capsulatum H143]EGC44623.1 nucleolar protein 12 [Histoplasma capsulatum var. duboisii H88]